MLLLCLFVSISGINLKHCHPIEFPYYFKIFIALLSNVKGHQIYYSSMLSQGDADIRMLSTTTPYCGAPLQ